MTKSGDRSGNAVLLRAEKSNKLSSNFCPSPFNFFSKRQEVRFQESSSSVIQRLLRSTMAIRVLVVVQMTFTE